MIDVLGQGVNRLRDLILSPFAPNGAIVISVAWLLVAMTERARAESR